MFRLVTMLSSWLMVLLAFSQDGTYLSGARSAGLGGSSITLSDSWSLFNNIGALGRVERSEAFAGYQNRFNLPELLAVHGGYVHHSRRATAGLSFYRFGGSTYNQQKLSIAIGNKIQLVSLGAGLNVIQYEIEGLDSRRTYVLEFGGVAELTSQLMLGAHIFNLRQTELTPTVMKAGLSYRPIHGLMVNVETEKQIDFNPHFKAGIEYFLLKSVALRTGISTHPFRGAYGLGFYPGRFKIDYAFANATNLGMVHEISMALSFESK